MITEKLAIEVLKAACSTGGDFAEIYVEDTESNSLNMTDGHTDNATYSHKRGAGVRVLCGTQSAYAYTGDLSREAMLSTAKAAAAAIKSSGVGALPLPFKVAHYDTVPTIAASDITNQRRIELLRFGSDAAKSYSSEITQVSATIMDVDQRVMVCNTRGVWGTDRRPRTRIWVEAVASKDGEVQTGMSAPGEGCGYELFDRFTPAMAGRMAAKTAITMLYAPECPGGQFPVVIDGGFGGVIFHEACGHSLEAAAVSKGNSEFCGKLGKKIASEKVTAIDDGTIPGGWGSIGMDDEGTPSRRRVLIENGILKSYMIDELGARRMDMPVTSSSRRQDYSFAPTSRMTNTFIAAGTDDADEMIATMGDGLFAKSMGGGSVNPLTGEFNFAVSEGYWVKNGKIFCPVRGATLIGKGSEVLLKIDRVGTNVWSAPGMCGARSGSIPTNVGQPRIRVSQVTVGGKGGAL